MRMCQAYFGEKRNHLYPTITKWQRRGCNRYRRSLRVAPRSKRDMQSQSRMTLRKAMWRNWVKRKYSAIVKWLGTYHTDLSLTPRNLIVSEEHGQKSVTVSGLKRGLVYPKKNSYYARVLASDYIQQIMASGVRYSSKNSRGIFLQMHNISSADPLWDKKNVEKEKLMSLLITLPWKG